MALTKIEKVAVVGASGRVGGHAVQEMLKTGTHQITALTRADSTAAMPAGVTVVRVDYDDEAAMVAALQGQDFLLITLSVRAPPDTHGKIVAAAAKAGVPYVMPNLYGYDADNAQLCRDMQYGHVLDWLADVRAKGMTSFTLGCGFWYEWSLALGEGTYGIDLRTKTATLFDGGHTPFTTSTWLQYGRAIAALVSLPASGASPSLADFANKNVFITSFRLTQREMLDSVHRVMGTTDADWTIKTESSRERYDNAVAILQQGFDRPAFARAMYTRCFFPTGETDLESRKVNDVLGLPKEDLDEATKRTVDMVENGWNPFA